MLITSATVIAIARGPQDVSSRRYYLVGTDDGIGIL